MVEPINTSGTTLTGDVVGQVQGTNSETPAFIKWLSEKVREGGEPCCGSHPPRFAPLASLVPLPIVVRTINFPALVWQAAKFYSLHVEHASPDKWTVR